MKTNIDDQASSLRELVTKSDLEDKENEYRLPPRSSIHRKKQKREKRKKVHLISVLLFVFLFIVILLLFFPFWGESIFVSSLSNEQQNLPMEKVYLNNDITVNLQEGIYHTVRPQDTWDSIARQYYHDEKMAEVIMKANDTEDNKIVVGSRLFIPDIHKK
ncbi:LysM peptidoglycan-binding domain-containing protein [Gracilibacillus oryzae]|nr:LysM domain-containing protein [Gracilibacillus oryzae]